MSSEEYSVIEINTGYILSVRGFLKIFEFILLLASFIFALLYRSFYHGPPHLPFFFAVLVVGFVLIVLLYLFFLFTLDRKHWTFNWRLLDVGFSGCLAAFLIVSAGLMAHEANFKEQHGTEFSGWFQDRLVAAVVLAFVAVIFLIIDIIVSLFKYFRHRHDEKN